MLDQWAKLKATLDEGQPWISSDKLKAVRLLGMQPFDAIDEKDVAIVFLASFALKPEKRQWYWEIHMEMTDDETKRFLQNAATRQLESLKPEDPDQARQVLFALIERATTRLTVKAEAHRERARAMAALAPDILAFDATPEGERLRRFDMASGRGFYRSLGELRKSRHSRSSVVSGPLSGVSGPLSGVSGPLSGVSGPLSVVSGPLSGVSGPLSVASREVGAPHEPNAPAEPTEVRENAPNEPTGQGPFNEERSFENAANESTDIVDNVTTEPTELRENATTEPTELHENVSGEEGFDGEQVGEPITTKREHARRGRTETVRLRELKEYARNEAKEAMAARRARLREQRIQNSKPGGQPQAHAERPHRGVGPVTGALNTNLNEMDEFLEAALKEIATARAQRDTRESGPDIPGHALLAVPVAGLLPGRSPYVLPS
jgi:hypothetical protein